MSLVLGVIPARYASTRFPGKVLAPLAGRPMLEAVWKRSRAAAGIGRLVVATDDRRVAEAAEGFGAEVVMTSAEHPSGTDRAAEVARGLGPGFDPVLVIQADEPLLSPTCLERLVEALATDGSSAMATLAEPIESAGELFDPNVVKVVTTTAGRALYFSRAPIPYHRGRAGRLEGDFRPALDVRERGLAGYRKHQGIYAYRRDVLLALTAMEPSPLEIDEGLEQLRALQAGHAIQVVESDFRSLAVDTPSDLDRVSRMLTEAN